MPKLMILMGPPGSGKSTHAKSMESQLGYTRISGDDQGKQHMQLFYNAVAKGKDIVVDRMGFDEDQRNRFRNYVLDKEDYIVDIIEFIVPRSVCFKRCIERYDHPTINCGDSQNIALGKKTIERSANDALDTYFSRYEQFNEKDYSNVLRIHYTSPVKTRAIQVDIDGTIANLDHRLHHVKGEEKKNWGTFFKECVNDGIYEDVLRIVDLERNAGTEIVLCSGRPENYRKETEEWLAKFDIKYDALIMRPRNNFKGDDITKIMLYDYEIKPYYNIQYVLDDRTRVVNAWRRIGLSCFQVRPGEF